ncbi:hypothetical protein B0H16DRAFT_1823319 [Mycena metata]|uniref:Uncharacterized protein n=1 Tax=Mycena metata TaxID=1033252 RepID=A0AAD7GZF4_9AGAR|nr:hypothetical protein B0H16DRAFT_1823319 [Mycena metata]
MSVRQAIGEIGEIGFTACRNSVKVKKMASLGRGGRRHPAPSKTVSPKERSWRRPFSASPLLQRFGGRPLVPSSHLRISVYRDSTQTLPASHRRSIPSLDYELDEKRRDGGASTTRSDSDDEDNAKQSFLGSSEGGSGGEERRRVLDLRGYRRKNEKNDATALYGLKTEGWLPEREAVGGKERSLQERRSPPARRTQNVNVGWKKRDTLGVYTYIPRIQRARWRDGVSELVWTDCGAESNGGR